MIGLKISRQVFNRLEEKPIAPCTRDFACALSKLQVIQVIARNSDCFIALFALSVIGQSYYFSIGFLTVV